MKTLLNDIYSKVAKQFSLNEEDVRIAYISYWKFIKETIEGLPLKEDITEEELNRLKVNFNIPSIGKLYCNKDTVAGAVKHELYKKKKNAEIEENRTSAKSYCNNC